MLEIMQNEEESADRRAWAAEKAAPYLHSRPAPIDRMVNIELPDTSTVEGVKKALDVIVQAMASEQMTPSEGASFMSVIETRRKSIETADVLARIEALEALAKSGGN